MGRLFFYWREIYEQLYFSMAHFLNLLLLFIFFGGKENENE